MTMIGATPLWAWAYTRAVWSAKIARVQSEGAPGLPASRISTGSLTFASATQMGGGQTYASRATKPDFTPGIGTSTVKPWVGGIGLIGCVVSFILGFIPPSQLKTGKPVSRVLLLVLAVVVLTSPPFVIQLLNRVRRPAPTAVMMTE